jgi:uncharacterized membrane protein (DUF106 family)
MAAEAFSAVSGAVTSAIKEIAGKGQKDSKYFNSSKKGEMHELKEELCSSKEDRKKEAVKKVTRTKRNSKSKKNTFFSLSLPS